MKKHYLIPKRTILILGMCALLFSAIFIVTSPKATASSGTDSVEIILITGSDGEFYVLKNGEEIISRYLSDKGSTDFIVQADKISAQQNEKYNLISQDISVIAVTNSNVVNSLVYKEITINKEKDGFAVLKGNRQILNTADRKNSDLFKFSEGKNLYKYDSESMSVITSKGSRQTELLTLKIYK